MRTPLPQHHSPRATAARPRTARLMPLLLPTLTLLALGACGEATATEADATTTYGAPLRVGNGTARTYVVARGDAPVEVGVALSEDAFAGLPADHAPGGMQMPDGHSTWDFMLPMPEGNPTPYRFVGLGWNPVGHVPPGVYDQPHFDFHFYTMSEADHATILPTDPQFDAKAAHRPAPQFTPPGYVQLPGAVPLMGAHWVDTTSAELHGQLFTRTFLYGSWDGRLTFAEPMVTKAFMETKPDVRIGIPVPARYDAPGYYAREYRVYWAAPQREYRVALTGLVEQR
ncbi:MAG TPA: DUF5602 domain-containing protein [Gemmatimonadaceae bacterium]|nr:DUF5602 domain-containing protein [Gemmatimonadaceae bacterium]